MPPKQTATIKMCKNCNCQKKNFVIDESTSCSEEQSQSHSTEFQKMIDNILNNHSTALNSVLDENFALMRENVIKILHEVMVCELMQAKSDLFKQYILACEHSSYKANNEFNDLIEAQCEVAKNQPPFLQKLLADKIKSSAEIWYDFSQKSRNVYSACFEKFFKSSLNVEKDATETNGANKMNNIYEEEDRNKHTPDPNELLKKATIDWLNAFKLQKEESVKDFLVKKKAFEDLTNVFAEEFKQSADRLIDATKEYLKSSNNEE